MRFLSLLTLCALALFWNACEKQPVGNDPMPGVHAEHSGEKHDAKAPEHQDSSKSSESSKSEEAPKFFPDKK